ncbi:MAG: hypothetical protein ACOY81_06230 [Bacillota bacterium]
MDITWLFLFLCPYMLLYFYLIDFTDWAHWKIAFFWTCGLVLIFAGWLAINYYNPQPPAFPQLF